MSIQALVARCRRDLPGGLSVRPAGGAGGVPPRRRGGARGRPAGGAVAVRCVLRQSPPRGVPRPGAPAMSTSCSPTRPRSPPLRDEQLRGRGRAGARRCGAGGADPQRGRQRDPARRETVRVAAEPAKVVDTTGAGDAYAAGFLAGLTAGRTGSLRPHGQHRGGRGDQPLRRPPAGRPAGAGGGVARARFYTSPPSPTVARCMGCCPTAAATLPPPLRVLHGGCAISRKRAPPPSASPSWPAHEPAVRPKPAPPSPQARRRHHSSSRCMALKRWFSPGTAFAAAGPLPAGLRGTTPAGRQCRRPPHTVPRSIGSLHGFSLLSPFAAAGPMPVGLCGTTPARQRCQRPAAHRAPLHRVFARIFTFAAFATATLLPAGAWRDDPARHRRRRPPRHRAPLHRVFARIFTFAAFAAASCCRPGLAARRRPANGARTGRAPCPVA